MLALFTKHSLQLRDPTQRDDACEATGSPQQIHHALLGVLRTVTQPPDYSVVLTHINKQINFTSHWINTILIGL